MDLIKAEAISQFHSAAHHQTVARETAAAASFAAASFSRASINAKAGCHLRPPLTPDTAACRRQDPASPHADPGWGAAGMPRSGGGGAGLDYSLPFSPEGLDPMGRDPAPWIPRSGLTGLGWDGEEANATSTAAGEGRQGGWEVCVSLYDQAISQLHASGGQVHAPAT